MGIINKITKRCIFCKGKDGCEYVPAFGIYGDVIAGNWYHKECLTEVICNPEKYSHNKVDMAIDIVDRIKESNRQEKMAQKDREWRCEYLKQHCI
jgi:hypothetical protein